MKTILSAAIDSVTMPKGPRSLGKHVETYETQTRELVIEGLLWSGAKSRHEYPLQDKDNPQTLAQAKAIAGDFAQVVKARIRVTHKRVTETVQNFRLEGE